MSLVFLAYVVSAFMAHPHLGTVGAKLVIPISISACLPFYFCGRRGKPRSRLICRSFIQSPVVEKGVRLRTMRNTRSRCLVGKYSARLDSLLYRGVNCLPSSQRSARTRRSAVQARTRAAAVWPVPMRKMAVASDSSALAMLARVRCPAPGHCLFKSAKHSVEKGVSSSFPRSADLHRRVHLSGGGSGHFNSHDSRASV